MGADRRVRRRPPDRPVARWTVDRVPDTDRWREGVRRRQAHRGRRGDPSGEASRRPRDRGHGARVQPGRIRPRDRDGHRTDPPRRPVDGEVAGNTVAREILDESRVESRRKAPGLRTQRRPYAVLRSGGHAGRPATRGECSRDQRRVVLGRRHQIRDRRSRPHGCDMGPRRNAQHRQALARTRCGHHTGRMDRQATLRHCREGRQHRVP